MLILISLACYSQFDNYYLKSYSVSDGLPNNHVRWITQDKDGFLWLATWDGLARFDGVEFKVYRHNPNDSNSVAFFEIIKVEVDSGNRVWVFAGGRLCRYDRKHDCFIQYGKERFPDPTPDDGPPIFFNILIDSGGHFLMVRGYQFYVYDTISDRFQPISGLHRPGRKFIPCYPGFDNHKNLWLLWLDKNDNNYGTAYKCSYDLPNNINVIDSFTIDKGILSDLYTNETVRVNYYENTEGEPCIASASGLFILENDTFRLSKGQTPPGLYDIKDPVIWSEPDKGLMVLYPSENRIDTLYREGEIETVISYYNDFDNNIWFCDMSNKSVRKGLEMTYRTSKYFRHYLTGPIKGDTYVIYGLYKDKEGNIWAGGRPNDHIVKITPDGTEHRIDVPFRPITYYTFPRNICEDDQGYLWITFFHNYVYRFNPKNSTFDDYSAFSVKSGMKAAIKNYRIVQQLSQNLMVAIGEGKINILNISTGEALGTPTINDRDIFSIYPDGYNNIWFGLSGKLFKCDDKLENQQLYDITDQFYNIEDICPGDSADLWLAMLGGGIGHFDIPSGKTTFYTTYNGLAHNTVYSIRKDHSGNLWVSHDLGISMFNPVTKSFTNFDEKDGLMIREFDSEAACQTPQGEILFGGIGGIVSFFPDSVTNRQILTSTQLVITDFRVSNRKFPVERPLNETEKIRLPKGTDNFQLEFVKPDFRNGDEIQYRYILSGSQTGWTQTDSKHRRINFTSLRPGKYEFQAECTDQKGEWANRTSLEITIPPYFYQTTLFSIFIVALVLIIILLFFIMKVKQIRLTERKKQEQLKLETLRGQMNPHFIYNSLNSINYFISLNDRLNANQYITDFSRLMRAIMMNASQEFINMDAELQAIGDYLALEHLRFSNKFDYEIVVDEAIDQVATEITPSLVQPFIENAIWHGLRYLENRKGFLSVRFIIEENNSLVCYVEDDGIGRKLSVKLKTGEQKKRKSRGIAIVQERLAIINSIQKSKYSVRVMNMCDDREETGTKVRIEIPNRKL